MIRLLPLLLAFVAGFVVGTLLLRRGQSGDGTGDWESKYRELLDRYRDLTRRLEADDPQQDNHARRASVYRQTLWDLRGILEHPDGLSPERAHAASEDIDEALRT